MRPKLAISLNGSNDALRSEVMPLNRKWNIAELMKAAREFPLRTRERLTFEYVLLEGVNDGAGARARGGEVGARDAGEGEFDCAESGVGAAVSHARGRARDGVSEDFDGGGNSGVCAEAARARYFCGVRTVEEDGGC